MTDLEGSGNRALMETLKATQAIRSRIGGSDEREEARAVSAELEAIYERYFDFVWRSLRRLGVPLSMLDDATQDVFVVVHRRLNEFQRKASLKTWLFSIALNIAHHYRRSLARQKREDLDEDAVDLVGVGLEERAATVEAARLVYRMLDALDEDRRAVFVLHHLEQMPATEIAQALGIPPNTVYSRLRLARRDFEATLRRHMARGRR